MTQTSAAEDTAAEGAKEKTILEAGSEHGSHVPAAEQLTALPSSSNSQKPLACTKEVDTASGPAAPSAAAAAAAAGDGHVEGQGAPLAPCEPLQAAAGVAELSPDAPSGCVAARPTGGNRAAEAELRAVDTMSITDKVS